MNVADALVSRQFADGELIIRQVVWYSLLVWYSWFAVINYRTSWTVCWCILAIANIISIGTTCLDWNLWECWFWLIDICVYLLLSACLFVRFFNTLCSEKNTHSHYLLYLRGKCLYFHKVSRNDYWGSRCSIGVKVKHSLLPVTSCWRHISVFFKLWVLPLKTDIWWNVKTHQLIVALTEPKNMLIRHAGFYCELFLWFIFLAECEIFNFVDVGRHTHTTSLHGWPLVHCQSNTLVLPIVSIFFYLKVTFHQYSIHCSLSRNNLRKLVAT